MSDERQDARLGTDVEPGPLSPQEQAEFFARPLIARLALVREDGYPFIVPLWFQWQDGAFWLVVREKAGFMPHLLHNPRVCLSLATDSPPYMRVTVVGEAEIVARPRESDAWLEFARAMTDRYVGEVDPSYIKRTARLPRWLIRVIARETTTWRGGGWHRRYTE